MKRFEESFNSELAGLEFEKLENSTHAIFGLSKDLKLNYLNPAWFEFAGKNSGEPGISLRFPIGSSIETAITADTREFYIRNFSKALRDLKVWKHEYECSSPEMFRIFSQDTYPLKNGKGLIVVNSLKVEQSFDSKLRDTSPLSLGDYTDENGLITQCSNCRKVQRAKETETWDWVPSLVSKMPDNVSHSICPICFDYHWTQGFAEAKRKGKVIPPPVTN